jgi:hypothetical protein
MVELFIFAGFFILQSNVGIEERVRRSWKIKKTEISRRDRVSCYNRNWSPTKQQASSSLQLSLRRYS